MQKLIILLIIVVSGGAQSWDTAQVKFEEFKTQPGIYYDEIGRAQLSTSDWKFVLFYNLTNYWQEWKDIQSSIRHLQEWCQRDQDTTQMIRNCNILTQPLYILTKELDERNVLLETPIHRTKRAPLEFIGTLASDLFGVLDQRDADRYHQQMVELQQGNLHQQQLLQQQTHILDVTANLVKKEILAIKAQYESIREDISTILLHEEFVDAVLQLSMSMALFKDTQLALTDAISDIHHGRVNFDLIPPSQLQEQLILLQQQIPNSARIPEYHQHWVQMYRLFNIKTAVVQEQLIFELRIPLLQRDEFQVFNIIPVPTAADSKFIFIQPSFTHVLVNIQRIWYYPITIAELSNCKIWEENTYVCSQDQPLFSMQAGDVHCELLLLGHAQELPAQCQIKATLPSIFLTQLQKSNSWILVLEQATIFDLMCDDQITPGTLQNSGLLTLQAGCTLRSRTLLISSHSSYTTTKHVSFLPTFNLIQHMQERGNTIVSINLDSDFQELEQAINELQQEESWTDFNLHDVHHYATSSLLLILLLVLIGIWWRRRALLRVLYGCPIRPLDRAKGIELVESRRQSV